MADQYLDFYTVPDRLKPTAALFPAVTARRERGAARPTPSTLVAYFYTYLGCTRNWPAT
jgi:hypothetical protein